MITKKFADHFALEWIESWNTHDLDRILSHYTDDFEMSSPYIPKITDEASGILKGKDLVGAYWAKALQINPRLHFELITTLFGVSSITLYYNGTRGFSAEVFHVNSAGLVERSHAHYTCDF
jgi:hypothetical protein